MSEILNLKEPKDLFSFEAVKFFSPEVKNSQVTPANQIKELLKGKISKKKFVDILHPMDLSDNEQLKNFLQYLNDGNIKVENPLDLLKNPDQLDMYLKTISDPTAREYADRIVYLASIEQRDSVEEHELQLLRNPQTRKYAARIGYLEKKTFAYRQ